LEFAVDIEETTSRRDGAAAYAQPMLRLNDTDETASALLLTAPLAPRRGARTLGLLRRAALLTLLVPLLLGAGTYVARPYLPPGLIPERWVELVDGWLSLLPRSLDLGEAPGDAEVTDFPRSPR